MLILFFFSDGGNRPGEFMRSTTHRGESFAASSASRSRFAIQTSRRRLFQGSYGIVKLAYNEEDRNLYVRALAACPIACVAARFRR